MEDGDRRNTGFEEAQRSLAEVTRRLIAEVRTSRAPISELDAARETLERVVSNLEPHRHVGSLAQADLEGGIGRFGETEDPMEYFPYSPIVGRSNPISPPVEFRVIDGIVHGRATFTAPFCGPPNHVHGGVIALVFDELLGVVTVANHLGAMTGTLTIRYKRPMPILEEVRMEGRPVGTEGRKVFVEGRMWHGETLLAEADGTFVQVAGDMREKLRISGD